MTTQLHPTDLMADPIAWGWDLRPGFPGEQPDPYQRFRLCIPMRGPKSPFLPVARGRHLALCVNAFEPGRGEVNQHAHDDEATWLVLAGEATFWGRDNAGEMRLTAQQGLLIPLGEPYRYQNTGDGLLVMLRCGARPDALPISEAFPVGSRPGGVELTWRKDLWPGQAGGDGEAFARFDVWYPLRGDGFLPWQVLTRGTHLGLHVSCLEPEKGEVNLRSHDDEPAWVVLHGEATFYAWEDNRELGVLHAEDGVLIPKDAHYRYMNTGDGYLVMLRYGGRAEPAPAAE